MLNIKTILSRILDALKVDYVVEQGTSGIWTYRKWHSGIAECWGRTDIVVPTSGAYAVAFPFTFVEITCNSVNAFYGYSTTTNRQATKYIVTDGSNDGILDRAVAYVRDYNGNSVNPYIAFDFHTKGLWKTWGGVLLNRIFKAFTPHREVVVAC